MSTSWVKCKICTPVHTTKDIISCHATTVVTFNCQLHSNRAIQFCSLHLHCSLCSMQELLSSSYHCWQLCALLVFCAKGKFCGQLLGKHPAGMLRRWHFYVIQTLGTYAVRMGGKWSKMSPVVSFSPRNFTFPSTVHSTTSGEQNSHNPFSFMTLHVCHQYFDSVVHVDWVKCVLMLESNSAHH